MSNDIKSLTCIKAKSCLFPSTKYHSFNQHEYKELGKKRFEFIPTEERLTNPVIFWPMLYSASHLTFIPTNQEPLSSTGKWHLARNSLPPRHLLMKIISKILLKMRDLTTFAVTTSSSSVGISKMTYQIKADIARITLSIFLSLETNIAWP